MVYLKFFGLEAKPFHPTPDPHFLYLSPSHKQALGSLIYGIMERKGFILLTGQVGLGKTTILRSFLSQGVQEDHRTVYLLNPNVSFMNLLRTTLRGLGHEPREGTEEGGLVEQLHMILIEEYQKGKTIVLLIDEAQNMPVATLEQLRVLSNLETPKDKLLQIVLVGQPELDDLLDRFELRQLRQRIAVQAILSPLSQSDSYQYIQHRMDKAGGQGKQYFSNSALRLLVREAQGIPRRLNILCDNALVTALGYQQPVVTAKIAQEVVADLTGEPPFSPWKRVAIAAGVVMVALSVFLLAPRTYSGLSDSDSFVEFGRLFGSGDWRNQFFVNKENDAIGHAQPIIPLASTREALSPDAVPDDLVQGHQPTDSVTQPEVGWPHDETRSDLGEEKDAVVVRRSVDAVTVVVPVDSESFSEKSPVLPTGQREVVVKTPLHEKMSSAFDELAPRVDMHVGTEPMQPSSPRSITDRRNLAEKSAQGTNGTVKQGLLPRGNLEGTLATATVDFDQERQVGSTAFPVTRIVEEDDTFEGLMRSVYGNVNPSMRRVVLNQNPHIGDGGIIFPAQKIVFPPLGDSESHKAFGQSVSHPSPPQHKALRFSQQILARSASSAHVSPEIDRATPGKLYAMATVKQGDTMEQLAKEVYGFSSPIILQRIVDYNPHILMGQNLMGGQRIVFPRLEKK